MPAMVSGPVPEFVRVTDFVPLVVPTFWLPRLSAVELRDTAGTATPTPLNRIECGDPAALSVMATVALRLPPAVGLNVTEMLHWAPAASDAPQVVVFVKSVALTPPMEMPLIASEPVPELVKVTGWAPLAVPTFWLAKVSDVELRDTAGVPLDGAVTLMVASVFQ
jgi:hypothetical protein